MSLEIRYEKKQEYFKFEDLRAGVLFSRMSDDKRKIYRKLYIFFDDFNAYNITDNSLVLIKNDEKLIVYTGALTLYQV